MTPFVLSGRLRCYKWICDCILIRILAVQVRVTAAAKMRSLPIIEAPLRLNDQRATPDSQLQHGKKRITSPRRTSRFLRDAPEHILKDIIYPPDPFDVLVATDARRRWQFDRLYQRYMNQIQYGCKNSHCSTPTCLSFRRRHARTPLRGYTELSARALAIHLLSERDPEHGLCRNEPLRQHPGRTPSQRPLQILQTDVELQHGNGKVIYPNRDTFPPKRISTSLPPVLTNGHVPELNLNGSAEHQSMSTTSKPPPVADKSPITPTERRLKDRASFTQWLFDSLGELFSTSRSPETTAYQPGPQVTRHQSKELATRKDTSSEIGSSQAAAQHENAQAISAVPDLAQDEERTVPSDESPSSDMAVGSSANTHEPPAPDLSSSASVRLSSQKDSQDISQIHTAPSPEDPEVTPNGDSRSTGDETLSRSWTDSHATLGHITKDSVIWLQGLDQEDDDSMSFLRQTMYYSLHEPDRLIGLLDHWHDQPRFFQDGHYKADAAQTFELLQVLTRFTTTDGLIDLVHDALAKGYNAPAAVRKLLPSSIPQQIYDIPSPEIQRRIDYLSDAKLAVLCAFGLHCLLVEIVPGPAIPPDDFKVVKSSLPWANLPVRLIERARLEYDDISYERVLEIFDKVNSPSLNRLFERITEVLSCRMVFRDIIQASKTGNNLARTRDRKLPNFAELLTDQLMDRPESDYRNRFALSVVAWCQNLFSKHWNRKPVVDRSSAVGGALQLLAAMFRKHGDLGILALDFYLRIFEDELSVIDMPIDWLTYKPNNKTLHILSFSFLFRPSALTEYFRSINYNVMHKSSIHAQITASQVGEFRRGIIPLHGESQMRHVMDPHTTRYLVLTVSRDRLLQDAFDQIWRLQRQELLRPLKVHLGMDEGEHGVDHGGVQQEFFRILFAQALDPDYGMFTIDDRTRMTWFRPGSLEPLYKYEMLGIMMSIAAYNFITLPVTFPLAFYRRLLGLKVKNVYQIQDGWPDLAKGLEQLLDWEDGDVSDVFMRTYEFSFETFGKVTDVDMELYDRETPWPPVERKKGKEREKSTSFELPASPAFSAVHPRGLSGQVASLNLKDVSRSPSPDPNGAEKDCEKSAVEDIYSPEQKPSTPPTPHEASLVTNLNRKRFVSDYIFWLTGKSIQAQLDAFATGFFTCLDRTAVSIFTPEALKEVIEGQPDTVPIDIAELESITKYEDGYDKDDPVMKDFWDILRSWSPAQVRALLEFVTASDRIPVQGLSKVTFVIQRNGRVGLNGDSVGVGDETGDAPRATTTGAQVGTVVEDGDGDGPGDEQQADGQVNDDQNATEETGEVAAVVGNEPAAQVAVELSRSTPLAQHTPPVPTDPQNAATELTDHVIEAADSSSESNAVPKTPERSPVFEPLLEGLKSSEALNDSDPLSTTEINAVLAVSPPQPSESSSEDSIESLQTRFNKAEAANIERLCGTTTSAASSSTSPAAATQSGPKPVPGRLPTAMTCFGRLLLPEYEGGKEVMRVKLEKAIENAKGFGVA